MWRAWVGVRRNDGAGSIDRIAPDAVEEYGVTRILDALVTDLREDRWHPMPFRRVFIPKSGSAERRAPCRFAVRDRIVQTSLQTVPILIGRLSFEAHLMLLSWLDPYVNAFGDLGKRPRP